MSDWCIGTACDQDGKVYRLPGLYYVENVQIECSLPNTASGTTFDSEDERLHSYRADLKTTKDSTIHDIARYQLSAMY